MTDQEKLKFIKFLLNAKNEYQKRYNEKFKGKLLSNDERKQAARLLSAGKIIDQLVFDLMNDNDSPTLAF